jgi:hypothetical protein
MKFKKSKKKRLIFILSKPLTNRDHVRFNFEYLKKFWNVDIFLTLNNKNKTRLNKLKKKNGFFIDFSYPSYESFRIQYFLKKNNFKKIKIEIANIPHTRKTFLEKINLNYFNLNNLFKKLFLYFYNKINIKSDIIFSCGNKSYIQHQKKNNIQIYQSNALDFDNNIKKKKIKKKYFVFLCQNFFENIENSFLNKKRYSFKKYWQPIINFSKYIKKKFNRNIIFIAHPDSKRSSYPKDLKVVFDNSRFFLKRAKIVFAHDSTAIQIAVINNAPIVHIVSDYLRKDLLRIKFINDFSKNLGTKVLNIDNYGELKYLNLNNFKINKVKYKKYKFNYISSVKNNVSFWKNFNKIMLEKYENK